MHDMAVLRKSNPPGEPPVPSIQEPPRVSTTTVSDLTNKKQISHLITHIGKNDPHLYTALSSLQSQNNQAVQNIHDLVLAINNLTDSINTAISTINAAIKKINSTVGVTGIFPTPPIKLPSRPGTGGISGRPAGSGGSKGNTAPIPKPVNVQ
jgi:hypothetical protein